MKNFFKSVKKGFFTIELWLFSEGKPVIPIQVFQILFDFCFILIAFIVEIVIDQVIIS